MASGRRAAADVRDGQETRRNERGERDEKRRTTRKLNHTETNSLEIFQYSITHGLHARSLLTLYLDRSKWNLNLMLCLLCARWTVSKASDISPKTTHVYQMQTISGSITQAMPPVSKPTLVLLWFCFFLSLRIHV